MPEQIDDNTVTRAKAGDRAAIAALYECYQRKIHRFFYYRLGDRHAAEDLTTEVFVRAIEALPRYRQQNTPLQAWLFRIARNLAVDYLRQQQFRNHLALDEKLAANGRSPDSAAALSLTRDQLQQALGNLTEGQCDVVVLRFVADMPIAEVAQTLNKSESAVKALQARGLETLHKILSQRKVHYDTTG